MLKVIFIDIDNTLLSFTEFVKEAMRRGFEKFQLKSYKDDMFPVFEKINNALWREIEKGTLTIPELEEIRWARIFDALDIEFDGPTFEKYFREQLFNSTIPEPDAMVFLEYLSQKYILCAASNGPYTQQVNRIKLAGMDQFFKHYFVSSKIGAQKPSQKFFDYCFDELRANGMEGLKPEETMIVGDSLTSDMAGGIGYGMHTCLYSKKSREEIEGMEVEHLISELKQIKDIL